MRARKFSGRGRQTLFKWILEHHPEKAAHPGVRRIQPVYQGDCDGLCGLYCILNGIRLVAAPSRILSDAEVQELFVGGVQDLASAGALPEAVCRSIERDHWRQLANALQRQAATSFGLTLKIEQPFASDEAQMAEALGAIERMILQRKAVMVFMRGTYRHYTVIAGYSPASLRLFDSFGYRWLRKASVTTDGNENARHRLQLASLLAISVS
jgi:hypothetical protein